MAEYYVNYDDIKHLSDSQRVVFFAILNQVRYSLKNGEPQPLPIWLPDIMIELDLEYEDYTEIQIVDALYNLLDYGLISFKPFDSYKEEKSIEITINPNTFIRTQRKSKKFVTEVLR